MGNHGKTHWENGGLPSGYVEQFATLKIVMEIVEFPIEHGDFPVRYVSLYQRV